MLTPFDDYPIHSSADPLAHPLNGDPNFYDRYFFNGQTRDNEVFVAAAMGHYPVRGVIDAAFSVLVDGTQHSVFASGRMPLNRATRIGPVELDVLVPLESLRLCIDRSATGLGADLTFDASTIALEEPRQRYVTRDGILATDHTRLTQFGTWSGTIWIDDRTIELSPTDTVGTRDRSWGYRPIGEPVTTNRPTAGRPTMFWLWAPIHFEHHCLHVGLRERPTGSRWVEMAFHVPHTQRSNRDTPAVRRLKPGFTYDVEWIPGTREAQRAVFSLDDPVGGPVELAIDRIATFRMNGIGYDHPTWRHGTSHGELEVGRETRHVSEFDPTAVNNMHIQSLVTATAGGEHGVGILENYHLGPHAPTGLTGYTDGWTPHPTPSDVR